MSESRIVTYSSELRTQSRKEKSSAPPTPPTPPHQEGTQDKPDNKPGLSSTCDPRSPH